MNPNQSNTEGAIRNSAGAFSNREQAVENQWARAQDAEKLKALRETLERKKKEEGSRGSNA